MMDWEEFLDAIIEGREVEKPTEPLTSEKLADNVLELYLSLKHPIYFLLSEYAPLDKYLKIENGHGTGKDLYIINSKSFLNFVGCFSFDTVFRQVLPHEIRVPYTIERIEMRDEP